METIENKEVKKGRNTLKEYFSVSEVFQYFFRVFRKDVNGKPNFNLRVMHGINRISIIMFLFAFVVWLAKRLFF
jgi:hypothetical protein